MRGDEPPQCPKTPTQGAIPPQRSAQKWQEGGPAGRDLVERNRKTRSYLDRRRCLNLFTIFLPDYAPAEDHICPDLAETALLADLFKGGECRHGRHLKVAGHEFHR